MMMCMKRKPWSPVGGHVHWYSRYGNQYEGPQKITTRTTVGFRNLTPRCVSKRHDGCQGLRDRGYGKTLVTAQTFSSSRWVSSRNVMESMVTTLSRNTYLLYYISELADTLTSLIVAVIIPKCVCIPNHHNAHLKFIQFQSVEYPP